MKTTNEIRALRRRVDKERKAAGAGRFRFSEPLRREVVRLAQRPEWTRERLADALGIVPSVIYRWCTLMQSAQGSAESMAQPKLTRVRVVAGKSGKRSFQNEAALTLELKSGAKVSGLTVEQLAQLLESMT